MLEREREYQPLSLESYVEVAAELARGQGEANLIVIEEHLEGDTPRILGRQPRDKALGYVSAVQQILDEKGHSDLTTQFRDISQTVGNEAEVLQTGETFWSVSIVKKRREQP